MRRVLEIIVGCLGAGLLGSLAAATAAVAHTVYAIDQSSKIVPFVDGVAQDPIAVSGSLRSMAVTPDGKTAYVASPSGVIPVDLAARAAENPIQVSGNPYAIAITPDGRTAYVASENIDIVTPIDLETHTAGAAIEVGDSPQGIAITPDGETAYVANWDSGTVTPVNTATNTAGAQIPVGVQPESIAASPDGGTVYAASFGQVTPIDTATQSAGTAITVGGSLHAIAISPDGGTAYVADWTSHAVIPVDLESKASGPAIEVGGSPHGIAVTPDGKTAYVGDFSEGFVTPFDTGTGAIGSSIDVGNSLISMSGAPSQPPTAELSAPATAYAGVPVAFGVEVADDVGLQSAVLDFGDGTTRLVPDGGTFKHAYTEPGTYEATVTVDDGEGCEPLPQFFTDLGLASPFTGQTAYCNGPSRVTYTHAIEVKELRRLGLSLSLKRPQSSLRAVRATATCRNIECDARAFGRIEVRSPGSKPKRFKLKPDQRELGADEPATLAPRIPAKARRAARKALAAGGKVRARVRVAAEAPGSQQSVALRRVRIVG